MSAQRASWDAIILGSDPDGLAAAQQLSAYGLSVLVLEEAAGLAPSWSLTELAPGCFGPALCHSGAISRTHLGHGVHDMDPATLVAIPGEEAMPLWRSPRQAGEEIARKSAADAAAYENLHQLVRRTEHARLTEWLFGRPPLSLLTGARGRLVEGARAAWSAARLPSADRYELLRLLPMSARDLLEDRFELPALQSALAAPSLLGANTSPYAPGGGALTMHHFLAQGFPRAAAAPWTAQNPRPFEVAREHLAQQGVEVRTSVVVSGLLQGDRIAGVTTAGGDELRAGVVLSCLHPRRTFALLSSPSLVAPSLADDLQSLRCLGLAAKVNLVLDRLPTVQLRAGDAPERALAGHLQVGATLEEIERAHDDAKYGRASERPILEATIPSLGCPSLAPAGRHVMSIWAHFAPYHLAAGHTWDGEREAFGDRVLARLEEVAPGITASVVARQVLSPPDIEQRHGLPGGHVLGAELALDQLHTLRPTPDLCEFRTPFPGLYLAGPFSHPGDTHSGRAGALAAQLILADLKRRPL